MTSGARSGSEASGKAVYNPESEVCDAGGSTASRVALYCRFKCELVQGRDVHKYGTRGRDNFRIQQHRTATFERLPSEVGLAIPPPLLSYAWRHRHCYKAAVLFVGYVTSWPRSALPTFKSQQRLANRTESRPDSTRIRPTAITT
ncbi:hypothetical protein J6590_052116 [Homalodisca vitripennis]|nr:hypothetical protein J6590_052116 [Homalodisca vitripennis]